MSDYLVIILGPFRPPMRRLPLIVEEDERAPLLGHAMMVDWNPRPDHSLQRLESVSVQ
jgi:hypothetical protein